VPVWGIYLDLRKLAVYASISRRKLPDLLHDPAHPLPHFRVDGKILVNRADFDAWIEVSSDPADLGKIVDELVCWVVRARLIWTLRTCTISP
jgi:hypothetical protein